MLVNGVPSSYLDLADPSHLAFEYMQQMAEVIERVGPAGRPLDVVHLGAAGCALARAIHAERPGSRQLAIELDTALPELVRGWFDLPDKAPIIARGDAAMIPQHPAGRPLEVAYGRVLEFPGGGRRYRYDVTTEGGSSGSPVFDTDLTLFGLHHAADPTGAPDYNQAVPLWRVARDLQAHNVVWTG